MTSNVIGDDVLARITRLKEAPGKDIVQYGFGDLSRLLLKHGLLDELRLWVHPLILGSGGRSDLVAYDSLGELPQFASMGFAEWLAQRTVTYHPMQGSQPWLV